MSTAPEKGFLSLKQASHISGYHPDYLSLLIRKGKLEGKMIGREWFTTAEALESYSQVKKTSLVTISFQRLFSPAKFLGLTAWLFVLLGICAFLFLGLTLNSETEDFTEPENMGIDKVILGGPGGEIIGRLNSSGSVNYSLDKTGEIQSLSIPQP